MTITNEKLAEAFDKIADILEEYEENPYRIRAYRRAARSLRQIDTSVAELINNEVDVTFIPHIGTKLAEILRAMVQTNNLEYLPQFQPAEAYPEKLLKRKRKLRTYKIYTIMRIAERILTRFKNIPEVKKVEFAGDYRRKKEVISTLDILIESTNAPQVINHFHSFPSVKYIIETSNFHTLVELRIGIQANLHCIDKKDFAAILLEKTGSTEHYKKLQFLAEKNNLKLKSNGLFNLNRKLACEDENDIYHHLNLEFIPPELRENLGEIYAAQQKKLPQLVELSHIKGDLHCHTNETDGWYSLEEMVEAAKDKGYQYVAITDHSKSLKITNGMDEKRLLVQIKKIDKLNEKLKDFVILKSIEVDILEDGSLDLSDDVLKELDLRVCSIHSKFRIPSEKQTARILRAMDNPYFNILGHATGRLINSRIPYEIDMDRILQAAKDRNCFIEVNAQPSRLDIHDLFCKKAKNIGVKLAISSDAHSMRELNFMILGINQARRGWLEARDVINTYDLSDLRKLLKRK